MIRPTEEGTVSSNTMPTERDTVLRNSSRLPEAALREMEGSMAEAMATPNRPRGSCMKRKANCNQLTGPFSPRSGSTMVEARLVLTATFTCTAAVPMMAGPIR